MQSVVERARSLVGARFRPQGRDPVTGVDCAGLAIVAFGLDPEHYRRDYKLRGDYRAELCALLKLPFRRVSRPSCRPGDLMVLKVVRDQMHLAVRTESGFVHADARLGRVTETPGRPAWPVVAVYRQRVRRSRGK